MNDTQKQYYFHHLTSYNKKYPLTLSIKFHVKMLLLLSTYHDLQKHGLIKDYYACTKSENLDSSFYSKHEGGIENHGGKVL